MHKHFGDEKIENRLRLVQYSPSHLRRRDFLVQEVGFRPALGIPGRVTERRAILMRMFAGIRYPLARRGGFACGELAPVGHPVPG